MFTLILIVAIACIAFGALIVWPVTHGSLVSAAIAAEASSMHASEMCRDDPRLLSPSGSGKGGDFGNCRCPTNSTSRDLPHDIFGSPYRKFTRRQACELAIDAHDTEAALCLGMAYADGNGNCGIAHDMDVGLRRTQEFAPWYNNAARFLDIAAAGGNDKAQWELSILYYERMNNYSLAAPWLKRLVEKGYTTPQFMLGSMYEGGFGVRRDYVQAADLYRKAANLGGDRRAFHRLGVLYREGKGVPKDLVIAYAWMSLAATGDALMTKEYTEALDGLEKELTIEQVNAAQKVARDWESAHSGWQDYWRSDRQVPTK